MIDKHIHQIWLGDGKLTSRLKKCQKTVHELHPDWEYTLHTDNSILYHKDLTGIQTALVNHWNKLDVPTQPRMWAFRADLLRLCIVYVYGGFYLDLDLYFLQSLDSMLDRELVLTKIYDNPLLVSEAVIGAPAKSDKILTMLKLLISRAVDADGVVSPTLSRVCRDNNWTKYCEAPIVFIPHCRKQPNDEGVTSNKYLYSLDTKAIHLWSHLSYDYKVLADIGKRLRDE